MSITNGVEYLAAAVVAKICPERARELEPFILVEHYPAATFQVGESEFEGLEPTFQQVRFADFRLQGVQGKNRIGEAIEWVPVAEELRDIVKLSVEAEPKRTLTQREAVRQVALALDAQRNALIEDDDRWRRPTIHKLPAYDPARLEAWCGYDPGTDEYFGRVQDDRGWLCCEQTTDLRALVRDLQQYAHVPLAAVEVLRAERVCRDNLPLVGKEVDWRDRLRLRVDDVLEGIALDRLPELDREALERQVTALRAEDGHGIRIIGTFEHDARMRTLGDDGREYLVEAKRFPLVAQFDVDGVLIDAAIIFDVAGDGKTRYLAQYIDAAQIQTLSQAGKLHLEPGVELSPATLGRTQDLTPEPSELSQRFVQSQGLRR